MLVAASAVLAILAVYQPDIFNFDTDAQVGVASVSKVSPRPVSARAQPIERAKAVSRDRMTSYLVSHGEFSRTLQGPMVDSRIFVQQASFEE
jgi:hypothetical protein